MCIVVCVCVQFLSVSVGGSLSRPMLGASKKLCVWDWVASVCMQLKRLVEPLLPNKCSHSTHARMHVNSSCSSHKAAQWAALMGICIL